MSTKNLPTIWISAYADESNFSVIEINNKENKIIDYHILFFWNKKFPCVNLREYNEIYIFDEDKGEWEILHTDKSSLSAMGLKADINELKNVFPEAYSKLDFFIKSLSIKKTINSNINNIL